jgi:hypothetical protein
MAAIRLIVESIVYSKDLGTAEYVQRTEATCLLFLSLTTWSLKERTAGFSPLEESNATITARKTSQSLRKSLCRLAQL